MSKLTSTLRLLTLLFFASLTQWANASDLNSKHGLELTFQAGELEADFATQFIDEDNAKHFRFAYDYQLDNGVFIGAGYLDGESGDLSVLDDIFDSFELEYDALSIETGYRHFFSEKQNLFLRLSVLRYNAEVFVSNRLVLSDDGTGYGGSAGWQYRLDSGLGFQVSINAMRLSSELEINSIGGGLSYHF